MFTWVAFGSRATGCSPWSNGTVSRVEACMSAVQIVFGLAFTMVSLVLVAVVAVFLYFFQNFPNFCVQIYCLGLVFRFRFKV